MTWGPPSTTDRTAIRRVCVFCGSSAGRDPAYRDLTEALARTLAGQGIGIVYGGGRVGLMGALADAALGAGGEVIGVMPQALIDREIGHRGLTDLRVVGSMHERKALMAELADGFVALPGGVGTLEELFEVWTWAQLGLHTKPCGVLDADGFYAPLVSFLDHLVETGFVRPAHRAMLVAARSPEELLAAFAAYRAPTVGKWLEAPAAHLD
ncbi:MAG: TIGR00730 family Rossman fold protein [Gemmatimonadales bacterium]